MRLVLLALAALAAAAPGQAAPTVAGASGQAARTVAGAPAPPTVTLDLARPQVRFGRAHAVSGLVAAGPTRLAGQTVVLEGQRKFVGPFQQLATTVTGPHGGYAFKVKLDRNYRLRAAVPALTVTSRIVRAYTFPAFTLTFQALRPGVVRLIQRYTVPTDVRLTTPTLFYLGPAKAKFSQLRERAKTRRMRAGRYRARLSVTLPAAWKGRFRFGSCFRTSRGTGMGDPGARCPRRFGF